MISPDLQVIFSWTAATNQPDKIARCIGSIAQVGNCQTTGGPKAATSDRQEALAK
jgi:hypothetical protein